MKIVTLELYLRSGEKEITWALVERQLDYAPWQCSSTHSTLEPEVSHTKQIFSGSTASIQPWSFSGTFPFSDMELCVIGLRFYQ